MVTHETAQNGVSAISVEEAGRRLGISRDLAYRLVRSGEIPSLRLGRKRVVVPVVQLEALLTGGQASDG
jgi:excisionase family DNA binding protein